MRAPRVALVGARRARQGLGPFVARYLLSSGAELAGAVCRSATSAAQAESELGRMAGRPVRGYTDVRSLLERETPDALAILSPHATHGRYLDTALEAGLHVLCEKPLLWGEPDLAQRAARRVDGFRAAGLLLRENCQWPDVLGSYRELYPETRGAALARFEMRLAPAGGSAAEMLADALSHPLSVLQAVAPDPAADLDEIEASFTPAGAQGACLRVSFRYGGRIETRIHLEQTDALPRPAALALNGHWAHREVREPGYAIYLTDGQRSVKVPDPLEVLVGRFVAELHAVLSGRRPPDPGDVAQRMRLFERVEQEICLEPGEPRAER